ncbi:MAG: TIGR03790 family protein [Chthoniobacteraceae bacterium]|nr:TIGR03790 family protein [Chthoniobacteraceae bacterium]
MKKQPLLFSALLRLCVSLFCLASFAWAAPEPPPIAVVFNESDPQSVALAGYYAEKRGIPLNRLIGLSCPTDESVSREAYDATIAGPLREAFVSRGWWKTEADITGGQVVESRIRYVALMRGVPLKIAPVAAYPGDKPLPAGSPLAHNEAAVDSELAVLGLATRRISGPLDNPAYEGKGGAADYGTVPWLLRVCRLDAAEPATVRRMIDDALAAEKSGLWGFAYVDARGLNGKDAYAQGDVWFRGAAADLRARGVPCVLDNAPALLPAHYPMTRAALYLGWYAGEIEGALADPAFRFAPGAVAVHLHSFSAGSLRAPLRGWCAPLLERGAAATLGNVFEPYLMFTPHLDIFERQLCGGAPFADAAYAAQPVLSWMTTFIGDPLYRPFAARQAGAKAPREAAEYAAFADGAARWTANRAASETWLRARAKALKSGVLYEGLGLLEEGAGDADAAFAAWTQARQAYREDADRIRCAVHAVDLLRAGHKDAQALALVRGEIARYPQADATELLRAIERQLAPPPPAPSPSAAPVQGR